MNGRPRPRLATGSLSLTSKIVTTCGCADRRAAARASRLKRRTGALVVGELLAEQLDRHRRPSSRPRRTRPTPSRRWRSGGRSDSDPAAATLEQDEPERICALIEKLLYPIWRDLIPDRLVQSAPSILARRCPRSATYARRARRSATAEATRWWPPSDGSSRTSSASGSTTPERPAASTSARGA